MGTREMWTPYVGVLSFLFACLAVARLWSKLWVRYLLGLGVAAFLYSLAGASALHGVLYVIAPYLWMAREAPRFIYLTGFSLCVLAAFGLDYFCTALAEHELWARLRQNLWVAIGVCLLLFLVGVFVPKIGGYWQYFSLLLILMSLVLLHYAASWRGFREGPMFRLLLIGLLFFDLNAFNWTGVNKLGNGNGGRDEIDVLNSLKGAADYLRLQPAPFRVKVFRDPEPNIGDAYGVQSLSGGGVTIDRYAWKVLPFTNLLNVSYLVRPASVNDAGPVYQDKDWKVYRNPSAFPRFWIVHQFKLDVDEEAMYQDTKNRLADLRNIAFVADKPDWPSPGFAHSPIESVQMNSYSAREIRATVNAASPGLLVLSEMYYPEWHATVNGKEVKIVRADQALRSIAIPAGQSSIAFTYRPYTVYVGALLSVLTCALVVLASFWRVSRGSSNAVPSETLRSDLD